MQKSEKNYWPHAIIGGIVFIVFACIATVVVALKYAPVEMDTFYFEDYSNIDKNINKIEIAQRAFNAKYAVEFLDISLLHVGNNKIRLQVLDKNGTLIQNAKIVALLTKPETNRYNQELNNIAFSEKGYKIEDVNIAKVGRWKIQAKITLGEDTGFFSKDITIEN